MRDFPNINAIGVELEGGWNTQPCRCHTLEHDGSVRVSANWASGEIPLGPIFQWDDVVTEVTRHYPHVTNRSCGLHVHLSFPTPGHYSAILSSRFEGYLHKRLMRYGRIKGFSPDGPFFQRLDGRNTYCARRWDEFSVRKQVRSVYKDSERYAFLNYCHALHGTVELRVLPAFMRATAAVKALRYVLESFERYLSLPGALVPHVEAGAFEGALLDEVNGYDAAIHEGEIIATLNQEVR